MSAETPTEPPFSTNTRSTSPTVTLKETPQANPHQNLNPSPKPYLRYYSEQDSYSLSSQRLTELTEDSLSAHNHYEAERWGGHYGDGNYAIWQYLSPSGIRDSSTSMWHIPQAHTATRTGTASSRTTVTHSADLVSQIGDIAGDIYAAGGQFDNVSARPSIDYLARILPEDVGIVGNVYTARQQFDNVSAFTSTGHLAGMFLEDVELERLFKLALDNPKIGGERLERNFRRILVAYSEDLGAISDTERQKQASKTVKLVAKSVAQLIRRAIDPETDNTSANLKAMESVNTSRIIKEYLQRLPPGNVHDSSLPDYSTLDLLPSDDPSESESSSINGDTDFSAPGYVNFLTSGPPMANLRERLQTFVNPASHARLFSETAEGNDDSIPDVMADKEFNQRNEETCCEAAQLATSTNAVIDSNYTNEEAEVVNLFQDLFFLPQSLPELIDMVFDLFRIPSAEEPELPGKTRVRWKCKCGSQLYDDFPKLAAGDLSLLQSQLQQINDDQGIVSRNTREIIQAWVKNIIEYCVRSMVSGKVRSASRQQHDSGLPLHSLNPPTTRRQDLGATAIDLHLMLCIDKGEEMASLYQASVSSVSNDEQLFQFLRKQYWKHRNFPSWFTLRCVRRLSLTQFEVDANDFAMLDSHNATCNPQCTCLPPVGRIIGNEYCCSPAPEIPLESHPAVSSKQLTHYFNKMHAFKKVQTRIYKQLPKRTSKLSDARPDDTTLAWGIYFEEGWHWRTVGFLVFLSIFGSLAFAVILWVVVKQSLGDAFTAGSFIIAGCAALLAFLAWKSMDAYS
ncbi:hypothetical protein F5Y14DRAFT_417061 [Nemania sp. NC0429]|nr:hypothetical protein F5Y14DRAFT_417061 [Nemania sp. NC0429]